MHSHVLDIRIKIILLFKHFKQANGIDLKIKKLNWTKHEMITNCPIFHFLEK